VLPIGKASPDAPESVPAIRDAAAKTLGDIQAALAAPVSGMGT